MINFIDKIRRRFSVNTNKLKQQAAVDSLEWLTVADADSSTVESQMRALASSAGGSLGKRSPQSIVLRAFLEIKHYINFYLLRSVNNLNILTSDDPHSIRGLAALTGFHALGIRSARGTVNVFAQNTAYDTLYIKNGSTLQNVNTNLLYTVQLKQSVVQIRKGTTMSINVLQGVSKLFKYVATGDKLFTVIIDDKTLDDSQLLITINGVEWFPYKKLSDMTIDTNGYVMRWNSNGTLALHFGDGVNGVVPIVGSSIVLTAQKSDGTEGNVIDDTQFKFVSGVQNAAGDFVDTSDDFIIVLDTPIIGGYDGDEIAHIRLNSGLQTPSNALITIDNFYAYFRRYSHMQMLAAWSEPAINKIQLSIAPNVSSICAVQSIDYWSLSDDDFILDADERDAIVQHIISDNTYKLLSQVNVYTHKLIKYGMLIKIKTTDEYLANTTQLHSIVKQVLHTEALRQYNDKPTVLNRIGFAKALQNAQPDVFAHINIEFVGDANYIDKVGDVDTTNVFVQYDNDEHTLLPILRAPETTELTFGDNSYILLNSVGQQQWSEI